MATEKNISSRIINKHDTEVNWNKATNFIPKAGEIIVYDRDETYNYERFKIGDGVTAVSTLPFSFIPSNWNQNDETALDYVKGRTHWSEGAERIELFKGDITTSKNSDAYNVTRFISKEHLISGTTYVLMFNNTKYELVAYEISGNNGSVFLGNARLMGSGYNDTGEPFLFMGFTGEDLSIEVYTKNEGIYSVDFGIGWEDIHYLDPKYIKDMYYEEEPIRTTIIDSVTFTTGGNGWTYGLFPIEIIDGKTYLVTLNDVEYECVAYIAQGPNSPSIGNGEIANASGGNGEPFFLTVYREEAIFIANPNTSYTISISDIQPLIHHIDPKYIKDMYYETPIETTVLDEIELDIGDVGAIELPSTISLFPNETYVVTINGLEYTCIAIDYSDSNNYRVAIGNASLCEMISSGPDTGEPFGICQYNTSVSGVEFATRESGIYTVSIKRLYNQITKVPEKYLPEIVDVIDESSLNAVSSSAVAQAIKNSVHLEKSFFTIGDNPSAHFQIQYFNEPKIYIAQDFSNNIHYYSEDALNWILISMPSETAGRIIYGKDKFIYRTSTHVYYSEDLITWNSTALPAERNWYNIVYGNDIFLTVAKNDDEIYYSAYSTDGIAWTETEFIMPISFNIRLPQGLQYIDNKFILGQSNTNTIVYSFDGITWKRNNFNNNFAFHDTIYGGGDGKILVTGRLAEYIIWAENDELLHEYGWHHVKLPTNIGNCDQIIYANNTFFITDSNNGNITYSTDCENWTTFNPANSSSVYDTRAFESICYDGEKFVASIARLHDGDSFISNCVMFSDDGFNWIYTEVELLSNGKNETADIKQALGIAQSNWNQNDETALDYVKGRTHWEESTELISEQAVNIDDYGSGTIDTDAVLVEGKLYEVALDGNSFMLPAQLLDKGDFQGNIVLGNPYIMSSYYENTGHNFVCAYRGNTIYLRINEPNKSTYTVVIKEITVIQKLDEKYLPHNIQSDWNQNGTAALDYIKNRPFYSYYTYGEIMPLQAVTFGSYGMASSPVAISLTEGGSYNVTFNGLSYKCIAKKNENNYIYIGNGEVFGLEDTGEPFAYGNNDATQEYIWFCLSSEIVNAPVGIGVFGTVEETVKLQNKYLDWDNYSVKAPIFINTNNLLNLSAEQKQYYHDAWSSGSLLVSTNGDEGNICGVLYNNSNNDFIVSIITSYGALIVYNDTEDGKYREFKNLMDTQDKLTGTQNQIVGFDAKGKAIAKNNPIPTVTTSDNGKFLRVVDGVWAAATVPNAEEVAF